MKREEIKAIVALMYGENSEITRGFNALCDINDDRMIPNAHLEFILHYIGCSKTEVMRKKKELREKEGK